MKEMMESAATVTSPLLLSGADHLSNRLCAICGLRQSDSLLHPRVVQLRIDAA